MSAVESHDIIKFCDVCESKLKPEYNNGVVSYNCEICKTVTEGDDMDRLVPCVDLLPQKTVSSEIFDVIINNLEKDVVAKKIGKQCEQCFMPFMTFGRFGDNQNIVFKCEECGYTKRTDKIQ